MCARIWSFKVVCACVRVETRTNARTQTHMTVKNLALLLGVHGLVDILALEPNRLSLHTIQVIHTRPHALHVPLTGSTALGAQHEMLVYLFLCSYSCRVRGCEGVMMTVF